MRPESSRRMAVSVQRYICILLLAAASSLLVNCGGSTYHVQNPGGGNQNPVSVSISLSPAGIALNSTATVSATVTNDPDNEGVDWELAVCQSGGLNCSVPACTSSNGTPLCGQLLNSSGQPTTHSASGVTLTYQPPSSFPLPGNALYVEFIALSTYQQTANAISPVTVTAFGSVLKGTYVYQTQGVDLNGQPYQIVGVITLDGQGNITAGQQTINTVSQGSVTVNSSQQNTNPGASGNYFAGSTYFVAADGRGTLSLGNFTDSNGNTGSEDFSLVVLSSSKALIAHLGDQYGSGSSQGFDPFSSSGTLELQDPAAASTLPTAGYAFVGSGFDITGSTAIAYGGVLNIDNKASAGSISGTGSLGDQDYGGTRISCPDRTGFAGSSLSPAQGPLPGVVTFNLVSACTAGSTFGPTQLTGYIVNASEIRLIEADGVANTSGYFTAGLALAQAMTGGFSTASFSGPYVFGSQGTASNSAPSSFTFVGVICPDGAGALDSCTDASGNVSGGVTDTAFLPQPAIVSAELSGAYTVDTTGIGRAKLTTLKFSPPPHPAPRPEINFYLTGNSAQGSPAALFLYAGSEDPNYPADGVGVAYPQQQPASGLSFGNPGIYGLSITQQNGTINNASGQMTSNPPSAPLPPCFAPNGITTLSPLSGCADDTSLSVFQSPPGADVITGAFACPQGATACPDPFGRYQNSTFELLSVGPNAVDYYLIDPTEGFIVETDVLTSSQVAFGYFAQRCDVTSATACQQAAAKSAAQRRAKSSRLRWPRKASVRPN